MDRGPGVTLSQNGKEASVAERMGGHELRAVAPRREAEGERAISCKCIKKSSEGFKQESDMIGATLFSQLRGGFEDIHSFTYSCTQ